MDRRWRNLPDRDLVEDMRDSDTLIDLLDRLHYVPGVDIRAAERDPVGKGREKKVRRRESQSDVD